MKDYETAIKFERACSVYRLLLLVGKEPTNEDNIYLKELRYTLDRVRVPRVLTSSWRSV